MHLGVGESNRVRGSGGIDLAALRSLGQRRHSIMRQYTSDFDFIIVLFPTRRHVTGDKAEAWKVDECTGRNRTSSSVDRTSVPWAQCAPELKDIEL